MIDMLISCRSLSLSDHPAKCTNYLRYLHFIPTSSLPLFLCHISPVNFPVRARILPQRPAPSSIYILYILPITRSTCNTEVHALLCTNKGGGFGDPHFAEPYGVAVQSTVKSLLSDSDNDTSSASNHRTDDEQTVFQTTPPNER